MHFSQDEREGNGPRWFDLFPSNGFPLNRSRPRSDSKTDSYDIPPDSVKRDPITEGTADLCLYANRLTETENAEGVRDTWREMTATTSRSVSHGVRSP